ncbi:hypothetical protein, partial [Paenibacillus phytohabitans]|uniref:hypothetical protein n=1 Tax=Paenibacillus phytohabitans TaxID=2654978 RepID=UPI003009352E
AYIRLVSTLVLLSPIKAYEAADCTQGRMLQIASKKKDPPPPHKGWKKIFIAYCLLPFAYFIPPTYTYEASAPSK